MKKYPLTPEQQRLWFEWKLNPESKAYNTAMQCELHGPLDVEKLKEAIRNIKRYTDFCRTYFIEEDGVPYQVYLSGEEVKARFAALEVSELPVFHFTDLTIDPFVKNKEGQAKELHAAAIRQLFNLTTYPLEHCALIKFADNKYLLSLVAPHIVSDGYSGALLLKLLTEFYNRNWSMPWLVWGLQKLGYMKDKGQYIDYIKKSYTVDKQVEDKQYWAERLQGANFQLDFKLPRKEVVANEREGRRVHFALDADTLNKLQVLIKSEKTTLFVVLAAGFNALLYRYFDEEDIAIGYSSTTRPKEFQYLCGFFVNTLLLRTKLDGKQTFLELVRDVSQARWEDRKHKDYPYGEIVREIRKSQPNFNGEANVTLGQTAFGFHELNFNGLKIIPTTVDYGEVLADLTLLYDYNQKVNSLDFAFEYKTEIFADEFIQQMQEHFKILMAAAINNPTMPLAQLPLLTEAEIHTQLIEWNHTEREYPKDKTIHQLFEEQVARNPDNVAVVFEEQQITYQELNAKANQLAHYLREQGVGQETLVGICFDRSLEMIIAILGTLKAGGAYVPIGIQYPQERINAILDDAKLTVVLTQVKYQKNFPASIIFSFNQGKEKLDAYALGNPSLNTASQKLIYVFYTSGSTGNPKGVMIEHSCVVNAIFSFLQITELNAQDRVLALTPITFDISGLEIYLPLLIGATCVLARDGMSVDGKQLREYIESQKITFTQATPVTWQILQQSGWQPNIKGFCGGEALPKTLAQYFDGASIWNVYGPTETTIWSTFYTCFPKQNIAKQGTTVSIGKPIANTKVYILDPNLNPVPIGGVGELYIGGEGVARGYLNRPDLTSKRFIPNPFVKGKLYQTGDLVRYLPDGSIEFIGRTDFQVKLRGFRIELGEIENVLTTHPAISQAVVILREDNPGQKYLAAYFTLTQKSKEHQLVDVIIKELRDSISSKLPAYMIPSSFMELAKLPLTPNGKIDRKALPSPDFSQQAAEEYVEPRTELERQLVEIWQEILQINKIGINDNFFSLGGHSLLIGQLQARIRQVFHIELLFKDLFENPTLRDMASKLKDTNDYSQWPIIVIDEKHRYEPFALTEIQYAYWIGRQGIHFLGNVGTHAYVELDFKELNVKRLEQVLNQLIRRHDMLRMIVLPTGKQQILKKTKPYIVEFIDLRDATEEQNAVELSKLRKQLSHIVYDTTQWPLFTFKVINLPTHFRFYISIDALIFDGASIQILLKELQALYLNPEIELTPLVIQFRDYCMSYHKVKEMPQYCLDKKYWLNRVKGLPYGPQLPLLHMHTPDKSVAQFKRCTKFLSKEIWQAIKNQAQTIGVMPTSVLLTLFGIVLSRWSRNSDFLINLTLFNRLPLHPDVHKILGDFTTLELLEFSENFRDGQPLLEQIIKVHKRLIEDLSHGLFDGVSVQREMSKKVAHQEIIAPVVFTSMINVEFDLTNLLGTSAGYLSTAYSITQTPQVWLDHKAYEEQGGLIAEWDYVEALFPKDLIAEMHEGYCKLVKTVANMDWNKDSVPEFLPSKWLETIAAVNATSAPISDAFLHTLFETQANKVPENIALITHEGKWTYRDIYQVSSRLAHGLKKMGVRKGSLVAVVMIKGWEQIPAVFGIMASGAAYLPINADLPAARIKQLLDISGAELILTQVCVDRRVNWLTSHTRVLVDRKCFSEEPEYYPKLVHHVTDLAYVIFTSGSTGAPKGVMISHQNAVNTILDINERFEVNITDKILGVSELWFDLSVYDIFGILAVGATLVLPKPGDNKDPSCLARLVSEKKITLWNSVPAFVQMLQEYKTNYPDVNYDSLRVVMMSGDWIPVDLPEKMREITPKVTLISMGGATEGSIWSIIYPIERLDKNWKSIPYGKALKNQKMYVLDKAFRHCPAYVVGEIYIGGLGVAIGYWKDEKKTLENFVIHPRTGERLYRTGDLGSFLPDGNIEFIGRVDTQIKIRGYRVELGEIESILAIHPAISQTVVILREGNPGQKYLAAYFILTVTAKQHQSLDSLIQEFRENLSSKLPDYMVPSSFTELDKFPLSSNGKVDREALPTPDFKGQAAEEYMEPRTEVEKQIAQIWQEILQIDKLGINENFFNLGGNSLLTMKLISQINKQLGANLSIRDFFSTPTIVDIAEKIASSTNTASSSIVVSFNEKGLGKPIYLVHHGVGISTSLYKALAEQLPEQPIYAINNPKFGKKHGFASIEEMATEYIDTIKTIQKQGPYQLGGFSMGGIVAYEMARQFTKQGEQVGLVLMLDSEAHANKYSNHPDELLRNANELIFTKYQKWLINKSGITTDMEVYEDFAVEVANNVKILEAYRRNINACVYNGRVVLLRAQNKEQFSFEAEIQKQYKEHEGLLSKLKTEFTAERLFHGWHALVSQGLPLEIYSIPGTHYELFTSTYIKLLAEKVKYVLSLSATDPILQEQSLAIEKRYLQFATKQGDSFLVQKILSGECLDIDSKTLGGYRGCKISTSFFAAPKIHPIIGISADARQYKITTSGTKVLPISTTEKLQASIQEILADEAHPKYIAIKNIIITGEPANISDIDLMLAYMVLQGKNIRIWHNATDVVQGEQEHLLLKKEWLVSTEPEAPILNLLYNDAKYFELLLPIEEQQALTSAEKGKQITWLCQEFALEQLPSRLGNALLALPVQAPVAAYN